MRTGTRIPVNKHSVHVCMRTQTHRQSRAAHYLNPKENMRRPKADHPQIRTRRTNPSIGSKQLTTITGQARAHISSRHVHKTLHARAHVRTSTLRPPHLNPSPGRTQVPSAWRAMGTDSSRQRLPITIPPPHWAGARAHRGTQIKHNVHANICEHTHTNTRAAHTKP